MLSVMGIDSKELNNSTWTDNAEISKLLIILQVAM